MVLLVLARNVADDSLRIGVEWGRRLRIEMEKWSLWTMSGISAGRSSLSRPRAAAVSGAGRSA